ncbi:hypothetical protein [Acidobacterium sp. S8]|uniref:hypothetical protein n=1 Tax=Acidobacterium sp. S8 TaxID=1641854 RepID=UPI00131DCD8B|nr:hypothetical protein [Acidobacterium sp. S8]
MSAKALFCISFLLTLSLSSGWSQSTEKATLSPTVKTKIASQLKESGTGSLFAFTDTGEKTAAIPINTTEKIRFHSLEDYLASAQDAMKKTNDTNEATAVAKPIASCKDPKALEPPPSCVVCKDGTILCSNAKFGMRVTMDEQHPQAVHPQD